LGRELQLHQAAVGEAAVGSCRGVMNSQLEMLAFIAL